MPTPGSQKLAKVDTCKLTLGEAAIPDDEVFTLKEAERKLIINALHKSKGNKSSAAQMLGISRKSLYKKLVDYNIQE